MSETNTSLQSVVPYDENLLERARTLWQFGDWASLATLDRDGLQHHPDRAKLALLAAAAQLQIKNTSNVTQLIRLAQDWGVSKKHLSQILIAGVHNSLGRLAALADQQIRSEKHFEASVVIGSPNSASHLISKARITEQILQITKNITNKKQIHLEFEQQRTARAEERSPINSTSSSNCTPYNKAFYDAQKPGSESSAKVILSLLFQAYMPSSIVDVGCGAGTWLKVARELGVKDFIGIDGEYAATQLVIPAENFLPHDLATPLGKIGKFELAMSLEVAEHLDEFRANDFIKNLCALSDVVLFSAAVPYQGGTDHRNENWPEYWAEKFEQNDYVPIDFIREKIWNNIAVEWWYRQNTLIFVRRSKLKSVFPLQEIADINCLVRIHPELYLKRAERR